MRQISGTDIISFEDNNLGHLVLGAVGSIGSGLPTTTATFATGAEIVDRSTALVWVNTGNNTSPVWTQRGSAGTTDPKLVQYAEVDISAANIVGTAAGQLGHAQGVILVPAAPAGFVNVMTEAVLSYTFATAAYTAGGNLTVNIGAGGAALTGLISAANSVGAASSKVVEFEPLATAGNALTAATSINLVAASAFTQPGTAAGTIKVHVWWKQVPI